MKNFKITETKQQVAVDILTELEVWMMGLPGNSEPTKSEQDVIDIYLHLCAALIKNIRRI